MTPAEVQAIRDRATAQVVERLRTILTSPNGVKLDALASYVAFETTVTAEEALAILALAHAGVAAAAGGNQQEIWARATVPPEISIHSH